MAIMPQMVRGANFDRVVDSSIKGVDWLSWTLWWLRVSAHRGASAPRVNRIARAVIENLLGVDLDLPEE